MTGDTPPGFQTVHVVQRMAPGGIETLVLDLARRQPRTTSIISLEGRVNELCRDWPALDGVSHRLTAFDRAAGVTALLTWALFRHLRSTRPSAVFVHHLAPLLYAGPAARLAGIRQLIHVEHDVWHYQRPNNRTLAGICGRVLRPRHVAVSPEVAEGMQSIFPGEPVTVIPPGIDMDRFQPGDRAAALDRLGLDPSRSFAGTVGRLVPVKSQGTLIQALAHLPLSVHVIIAGDGPERASLTGLAEHCGVTDRVHFLGHREDVESILPALDVFCLPSLNEGLPRCVLEAQACGIAVVASDVGGLRSAVCPSTGKLVAPSDDRALAAALAEVLDAAPPADLTRGFVEARFSWTATVHAFENIAGQPSGTSGNLGILS